MASLDLTQIRYFLALAKALNFTRAAEACNVTQPALTKSIQRLEDELGGSLLLRERSRTQLTPLGQSMLPLLQNTFDAAEAARQNAAQFRKQDAARLGLGLGAWVEPATVTPLLREIANRFPKLDLTIRHGETAALNDWLLASEIDVTMTADVDGLTERANRWPVFSDPIVALVPEDHALAGPDRVDMEQLRAHTLIGRLAHSLTHPALECAIRHRGTTEDDVHAIVQAGVGIALSTARRRVPPGVVRRAINPPDSLEVVVATMAGRPISRAADAFIRLARAMDWTVPQPAA